MFMICSTVAAMHKPSRSFEGGTPATPYYYFRPAGRVTDAALRMCARAPWRMGRSSWSFAR